ncbi:hypothetical protein [Romboutsia sp.]|uniref:hypothetical protein n=1 Tax=Romboutsia sp. TaxID=1965302 RepID=UPI003F303AA4
MYEVQMKYMDEHNQDLFNFTCESFNIDNNGYRFENITMNNFKILDLEVNNEDIALIKIK